jgi:hypothetical protein
MKFPQGARHKSDHAQKTQQGRSWDPHGVNGWHLGPAMEHHRCCLACINSIHAERISDTVEFFPRNLTVPFMSTADVAIQAATDPVQALQDPQPASYFPLSWQPTNGSIATTC